MDAIPEQIPTIGPDAFSQRRAAIGPVITITLQSGHNIATPILHKKPKPIPPPKPQHLKRRQLPPVPETIDHFSPVATIAPSQCVRLPQPGLRSTPPNKPVPHPPTASTTRKPPKPLPKRPVARLRRPVKPLPHPPKKKVQRAPVLKMGHGSKQSIIKTLKEQTAAISSGKAGLKTDKKSGKVVVSSIRKRTGKRGQIAASAFISKAHYAAMLGETESAKAALDAFASSKWGQKLLKKYPSLSKQMQAARESLNSTPELDLEILKSLIASGNSEDTIDYIVFFVDAIFQDNDASKAVDEAIKQGIIDPNVLRPRLIGNVRLNDSTAEPMNHFPRTVSKEARAWAELAYARFSETLAELDPNKFAAGDAGNYTTFLNTLGQATLHEVLSASTAKEAGEIADIYAERAYALAQMGAIHPATIIVGSLQHSLLSSKTFGIVLSDHMSRRGSNYLAAVQAMVADDKAWARQQAYAPETMIPLSDALKMLAGLEVVSNRFEKIYTEAKIITPTLENRPSKPGEDASKIDIQIPAVFIMTEQDRRSARYSAQEAVIDAIFVDVAEMKRQGLTAQEYKQRKFNANPEAFTVKIDDKVSETARKLATKKVDDWVQARVTTLRA